MFKILVIAIGRLLSSFEYELDEQATQRSRIPQGKERCLLLEMRSFLRVGGTST